MSTTPPSADPPPPSADPPPPSGAPPAPSAAPPPQRWGAGRIIAIVFGAISLLLGVLGLAAGVAGIVYDQTQRDSSGFLMTGPETFSTTAYALVSNSYEAGTSGDIAAVRDILGTVRVRAETPGRAFVGIARATDVTLYLGNVRHAVVDSFDSGEHLDVVGTGEPATPPSAQTFWAVSSAGSGPQTISWDPQGGSWRIVVMKASGAPGVVADVEIGAKVPNLIWFGVGFLVAGLFLLALGGFLVYVGVRRR